MLHYGAKLTLTTYERDTRLLGVFNHDDGGSSSPEMSTTGTSTTRS
jgi:hypothetical protein